MSEYEDKCPTCNGELTVMKEQGCLRCLACKPLPLPDPNAPKFKSGDKAYYLHRGEVCLVTVKKQDYFDGKAYYIDIQEQCYDGARNEGWSGDIRAKEKHLFRTIDELKGYIEKYSYGVQITATSKAG